MGDLYDERKEGTQTQISAHDVGSDGYHARDLAYVHLEMQHGNTRLLTGNTKTTKPHALCAFMPYALRPYLELSTCPFTIYGSNAKELVD